MMDEIE
jgi:Vacuolar sorting-associated protein 13, N-terminal